VVKEIRLMWLIGTIGLATGCAGGASLVPGEPAYPPPPEPAWRPGEALALLLKPPAAGAKPIDDAYLAQTAAYRARIEEADAREGELRAIVKRDRGGKRTWHLDGSTVLYLRIDIGDDGTVDQSQYFGPEGLYAVVHRFAGGRRVQRIYWPPGQPRTVEVRDTLPPYPGVWWETTENPFAPLRPADPAAADSVAAEPAPTDS
jgi:hypothetical protein